MSFIKIFSFSLLLILVRSEVKMSYRDSKFVEFEVENEKQFEALKVLEFNTDFIFLDPISKVNSKVELIIKPAAFLEFQELADENEIDFKVLTEDLQSWFDAEQPPRKSKEGFGFDRYNTFEEILNFLNETHQNFPTLTELFSIGKSFEGRDLMAIKITKNENNPIIFIDANIHAREWIASATAVWVINEILTSSDPNVRSVLDELTIIIIPMLNPDGYIYSYDVNRIWRKNRSTHSSMLCPGVDLNRNFEYNWMVGFDVSIPCTDTYSGLRPFSEPETKALNDFYATVHEKVVLYLALHNAAVTQMLLYPWGHIPTFEGLYNKEHLDEVSQAAHDAITARHNTSYIFGNTYNTNSPSAGTARDHMYGHYGTPFSFTWEMRRAAIASNGGQRAILPPEEIIPNCEEVWDGMLAMFKKIKELGYY